MSCYLEVQLSLSLHARAEMKLALTDVLFEILHRVEPFCSPHFTFRDLHNEVPTISINI